jgi:hypothetical protein
MIFLVMLWFSLHGRGYYSVYINLGLVSPYNSVRCMPDRDM